MKNMMAGAWWTLLLRGILAILLGIIAINNVGLTALAIFVWFVFYAIADGIFHVYMSIVYRHDTKHWWVGLLSGLLSIAFGIAAFMWPQITAYVLLVFIAARAIIDGVLGIVQAIQLRKEVKGEWLLIVGGVAAVLFGIWMFFNPKQGGVALLWIIAVYAIVTGVILVIQAFRMRGRGNSNLPAPAHQGE